MAAIGWGLLWCVIILAVRELVLIRLGWRRETLIKRLAVTVLVWAIITPMGLASWVVLTSG